MNFKEESPEVFYATGQDKTITDADIDWLKAKAEQSVHNKARICLHPDPEDLLHEMVIVHRRHAYVRPHKHPGKSESFHMIEGEMLVVAFDDQGRITARHHMGATGSGAAIHRMESGIFHTVLPLSDYVVFHEITNGPFRREGMVCAGWAPQPEEADRTNDFIKSLLT